MIKSCNIVIYYRLLIYSNIKDVLFGQKARETISDGFTSMIDDVGI